MSRPDNPRVASAQVHPLLIDRWSPRSFSPDPLSDDEIASLFEGARWSPSSFNGQPWLFLYETDGADRPVFDSILMPRNPATRCRPSCGNASGPVTASRWPRSPTEALSSVRVNAAPVR